MIALCFLLKNGQARACRWKQLSLLVSMDVLGLTLSLLLVLPERRFEFGFLGSDASIVLSGPWLFAILLSVMTAAGVESIMPRPPARSSVRNTLYCDPLDSALHRSCGHRPEFTLVARCATVCIDSDYRRRAAARARGAG